MGLGRLVNLDKTRSWARRHLSKNRNAVRRERLSARDRLAAGGKYLRSSRFAAGVSPMASRVAVPVFKEGIQVGKATTTTWSPTLKRMIALATVRREYTRPGTRLQFEITVEAVRHHVRDRREDAVFQSQTQDSNAHHINCGLTEEIVDQYDPKLPLDRASTIPSSWYTDKASTA